MELLDKIQQDLVSAMKDHSDAEADILKILISALKNERIKKGEDLSKEEEIKVVFSESKKIKDSIEKYEEAGRNQLAQRERKQLEYVMEYLPEQASKDDIEDIVDEVIKEVGAESMKDMGPVMGKVMNKLEGKADGAVVSKVVRSKLS
jgi:hypothetical protein